MKMQLPSLKTYPRSNKKCFVYIYIYTHTYSLIKRKKDLDTMSLIGQT